MPRITIQQFRERLAARAEQDSATHAYREIARRPELARGMARGEWAMWTPADAHAYREIARRPELMRGMALGDWAVWPPIAAPQPAA
jgi:hypothetical protein